MNHRLLLFLTACIPARLGLAFLSYRFPVWMAFVAIAISFHWLCTSFPATGFFGGKVWWGGMRKVHAVLYLLFAAFAFYDPKKAYLWLLLDALVGFLAGFVHYVV